MLNTVKIGKLVPLRMDRNLEWLLQQSKLDGRCWCARPAFSTVCPWDFRGGDHRLGNGRYPRRGADLA